jgi:two-component system, NarL family, nitrate/nitrite response regulator NarL
VLFDYEKTVAAGGVLFAHSKKVCMRILIADESRDFRKFIRRRFEPQSDFEVIGEALSGSELLPLVRQLKPDIVLVDIAFSGMAGLEGTRRIKVEMPSTRVIFLSVVDEEALRDAAARYGADDFLTKDLPISEMFSHIRRRTAKTMPKSD